MTSGKVVFHDVGFWPQDIRFPPSCAILLEILVVFATVLWGGQPRNFSNPFRGKVFICSIKCPDWLQGPLSLLFSKYWGTFYWGKVPRAWSWPLVPLVSRLRMSGPLPPYMPSWHAQGHFYLYLQVEGRLLCFLFVLLLQLSLGAELGMCGKITIVCTVSECTWKTWC